MSGTNGTAPPLKAGPGPGTRPPRRVPPAAPFPLAALPRPLRLLAEAGAAALVCDPSYLAVPALTACAAAVGNARHLRIKHNWAEPPTLWTVIVGDSGTLKTPAYRLAMAPLWRVQAQWRADHRAAARLHEEAVERWKDSDRRARDRGEERPAQPCRPVVRRCTCSDITIERLAEMLEDAPKGLLVARDELAGWLGSFTRYKAQGTDLPNWLELYQAGTVVVDRKTADRKSVVVTHASACVTGGIQPGTLARCLKEEHFEAGLVSRLLMAWPARRPKKWSEADIPPEVTDSYQALLERLLGLTMREVPGGERVPHRVPLAGPARGLWVAWYESWAAEQEMAEGELAACYSKIEAAAARLALVHHCCTLADVESDDLRDLLPASMEAGIELARWFAGEARRVYALIRSSDEERELSRLAEWVVRQGGKVTARRLCNSNGGKYPDAESARAALDSLAQAGLADWVPVRPGEKGGRPSEALFYRHPTKPTQPPDGGDGGEPDTTPPVPDETEIPP